MDNPHAVSWFEIPCTDFKRATKFYSAMYDQPLYTSRMESKAGDHDMCFLPRGQNGVGGAITNDSHNTPGTLGVVIYLNAGQNLQPMLERAIAAGATLLMKKTKVNEIGYIAFITDTEGNKIGLHSEK